jgi:Protein of unknown function (DUF1214)
LDAIVKLSQKEGSDVAQGASHTLNEDSQTGRFNQAQCQPTPAEQDRIWVEFCTKLKHATWSLLQLSTTDGLKNNPDGSLTITIQKDRPTDTSNWFPAPDGPFNLTMRLYGPEPSVLDGSYRLPAVKRIQ